MQFRKDINGLRAIAVIAVVLFHFNETWLPGGFAGVDVFFVISGFLMTSIIFRGIEQKKFSLLKFYVARANRIIPALAFLCFVIFLFTWYFLTPLDLKALGKYTAGSLGFFSNILYWKDIGYFDANIHNKWLLHTWSLSAEWQFYIIYPFILVIARKYMSIKTTKVVLFIITILGFIFCIIITYFKPEHAYYLLPTRAWEMLVGGIAYLYPLTVQNKAKKMIEWFGILLVLTSYFFISKTTPWPGYFAFFPVLGAFLIMQPNNQNSLITNNIVFQQIGKWSYSIYLWHWPFVVLFYYYSLSHVFIYVGITLSVLFGFLSYTFIEKINLNNNLDTFKSYLSCKPIYIVLVGFLISGAAYYKTNWFYNIPEDIFNAILISPTTDGNSKYTWDKLIELNQKTEFKEVKYKVLTIGDSQSGDFVNSLHEVGLNKNVDIISRIIKMRCEVFYVDKNSLQQSFQVNDNIINGFVTADICKKQIERLQTDPIVKSATIIIVSMLWKDKNMSYIMESLRNLREANKKAVIYVVGGKSFNKFPQNMIYESYIEKLDIDRYAFDEISNNNNIKINFQNYVFNKNKTSINFEFIDMQNMICKFNKCSLLNEYNLPFYFDDTHLTPVGAKYIGTKIKTSDFFPSDFYLP